MSQFCGKSSFIHSFRLFLKRLFKSTTTQRRSGHSADTVSEFHVEAPQATVSEGLLPKVPTWRLERESTPCPIKRKASTLPMRHPRPTLLTLRVLYADDCLLYADDMLSISPSVNGLQHMLDLYIHSFWGLI